MRQRPWVTIGLMAMPALMTILVVSAALPVPAAGQAAVQGTAPTASAPGKPRETFSPQTVDADIEASAKASRERGDAPLARYRKFVIVWPDDTDGYLRLAKHAVMLLTVITQDSRELPVDRVYIRAGASDLVLRKIWSQRSEVASGSFTAKVYGRYREDGFYLVPGGRLMGEGTILADLTSRRSGMSVTALPTGIGRAHADDFPPGDPARRAKLDAVAFRAFMEANFPGYPLPRL